MEVFVIGYPNCSHYKQVCKILPDATHQTVEGPFNRNNMQKVVEQVSGSRRRVDFAQLHFWSPQILCLTNKFTVCIDGENALKKALSQITTLGLYVQARILKQIE